MAFAGFTFMNPLATAALLDSNRWRTIIYSDTPKCLEHYERFKQRKGKKKDPRKAILLLFGAQYLQKVKDDFDLFHSVFVFDDRDSLHKLEQTIPAFKIADVEEVDGTEFPKHLTPSEVTEIANTEGLPEEVPLVEKLTAALSARKPSVLETTSRMPTPPDIPFSGVFRIMDEIKHVMDQEGEDVPFSVALDTYVQFVFRMIGRNKVTSQVTRKLKNEAVKDMWSSVLDFAASEVGLRMAVAFRSLCLSKDPDYRVGHAVRKFGLKSYSGDFLYFTSVLPPVSTIEFLDDMDALKEEDFTGDKVFVPPVEAAKKKAKKA